MATLIGSLSRKLIERERLNILTFPTHERYAQGLALTGHNFYLIQGQNIKNWETKYAPLPSNHHLLEPSSTMSELPLDVDFDLVLGQHKFGQYQIGLHLAKRYHLPLVQLEHTLPMAQWHKGQLDELKNMKGDINLFISEYSRNQWGWSEAEAEVIHHGVDSDLFNNRNLTRTNHIFSCVNDWINRDWCCGFNLWRQVTQGLPVKVMGNTPGLSEPAKDTEELIQTYNTSRIFLNTSLVSPVPSVLLEAMSCGCACISTANCMIPEIIENGVNGLIANSPQELRFYCEKLLKDEEYCKKLGRAGRQTIIERFGMDKFVNKWKDIFSRAANIVYKG